MFPLSRFDSAKLSKTFIITGLLVVLLGSLSWRYYLVTIQMPYSGHEDERPLNRRALKIAKTGNLNPGWFDYPTLPIYLCSAGMVVGAAISSLYSDTKSIEDVSKVGHPYYSHPEVMIYPRMVFVIMGVLCLLFCALAARRFLQADSLLLTATLFCLLSPSLFFSSWKYINVDICATFFCTIGIWYVLKKLSDEDIYSKVIVPAVICGAATASKYNSGLIVIPFLISILIAVKPVKKKFVFAFLLGLLTITAFVIFVPYSVLNWDTFIHNVMRQIRHYARGHRGYEAEPGWDQLIYYIGLLFTEFGIGAVVLAVIGVVVGIKRDRNKTIIVASLPIAMILYMSTNRVHFTRTVLPMFPPIAVLMSVGMSYSITFLAKRFEHTRWIKLSSYMATTVSAILIGILILYSAPLSKLRSRYSPRKDSRNLALYWIEDNLPKKSTILYPNKLYWQTRELREDYNFTKYGTNSTTGLKKALKESKGRQRYLAYPKYRLTEKRSKHRKLVRKVNEIHVKSKGFKTLAQFGEKELAISRNNSLIRNPRFDIVYID